VGQAAQADAGSNDASSTVDSGDIDSTTDSAESTEDATASEGDAGDAGDADAQTDKSSGIVTVAAPTHSSSCQIGRRAPHVSGLALFLAIATSAALGLRSRRSVKQRV